MNTAKRELIRRTLQNLAESQAATLELLDRTFSLIGDVLGIDAVTYWRARATAGTHPMLERLFQVDPDRLQVVYQGNRCELDDTPFKLLQRLAKRPNAYVSELEPVSEPS